MLRRFARTVVANPRRAAAIVAATTASIAAFAASTNASHDELSQPSRALYTRFKAVEFKTPSTLARTFQFAQSIEPGEFVQSTDHAADHQSHRAEDDHEQQQQQQQQQQHVNHDESAPVQHQQEAHHCEHCEAPAVVVTTTVAATEQQENTEHQQHQRASHDVKEEATPLDAPSHAEHHHHHQQQQQQHQHFDAHELPPHEAEKRVAVDPVVVTLAGVRAQEFIELERHYRAQLEEALAHKEREFAERLQVERAKMQEEYQEALEDYEGQIKEQYSDLLASKAASIQKQLAKRFEERVLEIEDQYKRAHLRLEKEIHEKVLKEANRRADIVGALRKRLHILESSLAKKEQEAAADLRSQQICLAIFALSTNALDKPGPFKKQLERALEVTAGHDVIQEALNAIPQPTAARGVTPIQELNAQFKEMRNIGRRDALIPEGGGLWWELFASAVATITSPVRGWVEGNDPDAIFARAEYLLERGNIKGSIDELGALKGLASVAARSWIKEAQDRLAVEQAIYTVRNYVANSLAQEHASH